MRHLLVIVLMFMLPLQWSWAAAASICAHESDAKAAHFGHHEHKHDSAQPAPQADDQDEGAAPAYHADCGVCHGVGTAFLGATADVPVAWSGAAAFASYKAQVPDRSVGTLLRPPLTLVS
jgi:cytochrome c5